MPSSRLTKIIATVGPASHNPDVIKGLIEAGANVFRINCSHSDFATREKVIKTIRRFASKLKKEIGVLLDLQGPKIRVGKLDGGAIFLKDNKKIVLTALDIVGTSETVHIVNFHELINSLKPTQRVLLDDGLIELKVLRTIDASNLQCMIIYGGILKDGKGVNCPETDLKHILALTEKDIKDLKHGLACGVDYVALSFESEKITPDFEKRLVINEDILRHLMVRVK